MLRLLPMGASQRQHLDLIRGRDTDYRKGLRIPDHFSAEWRRGWRWERLESTDGRCLSGAGDGLPGGNGRGTRLGTVLLRVFSDEWATHQIHNRRLSESVLYGGDGWGDWISGRLYGCQLFRYSDVHGRKQHGGCLVNHSDGKCIKFNPCKCGDG